MMTKTKAMVWGMTTTSRSPELDILRLKALVESSGLSLVGVVSRLDAESVLKKEKKRLEAWQDKGFAADLDYMKRPGELFCDLDGFLPGTRSVISLAVSYYSPLDHQPKQGFGRVARCAWGKDYHRVLKKRLKNFIAGLTETLSFGEEIRCRQFSDAVPLLERALFSSTGSGFIGKNTMMIVPGVGSWTFVAELLTNIEVQESRSLGPVIKEGQDCGTCTNCLVACPTKAFEEEYSLNAGKCISYLTIEKKNSFSDWEQQAVEDWVFGCDVCQEVCPFNHAGISESEDEKFAPSNGVGPWLNLDQALSINSKEDFLHFFAGTPLLRAGRDGLIRNAAAVVANQQFSDCKPQLIKLYENSSESQLVQNSAYQALERIG